jgi:hypothetical protein
MVQLINQDLQVELVHTKEQGAESNVIVNADWKAGLNNSILAKKLKLSFLTCKGGSVIFFSDAWYGLLQGAFSAEHLLQTSKR